MRLEKISLFNFKNYENADLALSEGVNCFTGPNGSGKTNLLDAIYYLCSGKSAFTSNDHQNIRHGENGWVVTGNFFFEEKHWNIGISVPVDKKKEVFLDKKAYEKLSQHVGRFPAVLVTPYDTDLIRGSSEGRRKFFDSAISQFDKSYLDELIKYNHVLKQRNSLLKRFFELRQTDKELLDPYDLQLAASGEILIEKRKQLMNVFLPMFREAYAFFSDKKEQPSLSYEPSMNTDSFYNQLKTNYSNDYYSQRTSIGPHTDDYTFSINDQSVKRFGSQGQQKSFLIALKLTVFNLLETNLKRKPLLLLDDIFDKLDPQRIGKLMELVQQNHFGQVFITDASPARCEEFLLALKKPVKFFNVNEGSVLPNV
ncbi:MAG: DNA replication/repair protein RecF [Cytophagales bacterium]|nr:DNA replication/repair protein RecF [Cytophagales bacterium]